MLESRPCAVLELSDELNRCILAAQLFPLPDLTRVQVCKIFPCQGDYRIIPVDHRNDNIFGYGMVLKPIRNSDGLFSGLQADFLGGFDTFFQYIG